MPASGNTVVGVDSSLSFSKRSRRREVVSITLVMVAVIIACVTYFVPGFVYAGPAKGQIVVGGHWLSSKESYIQHNQDTYIPFTVVQAYIDPHAVYDQQVHQLVITTQGKLIRLSTDRLAQWVNNHPVQLYAAPLLQHGQVYMSTSILKQLYGAEATVTDHGILVVDRPSEAYMNGSMRGSAAIRQSPSYRAPYRGKARAAESVRVYIQTDGWALVRAKDGVEGYVPSSAVNILDVADATTTSENVNSNAYIPKRLMGQPLSMTFEAVYTQTPDVSGLTIPAGLNVVTPTWFTLSKDGAHVQSTADVGYSSWAHAHNLQVWALMSNGFSPGQTHLMLQDPNKRQALETALVLDAKMNQLDGVNIDFEDMYQQDRDDFTQFLRELTPLLHEAHVTVSVDVTPVSNSPNWSLCYDRPSIASVVDYVVLMAYDEHTDASDPGSVADLPWVKRTIQDTLAQVPANRLVLGIPLYARLWAQTGDHSSVKAMSINEQNHWIEAHHAKVTLDPATGQHYVKLQEGDTVYQMWLEDTTSLEARAHMADQYSLAGVASWARSFGTDEAWASLEQSLGFQQAKPLAKQ